jgi:hypothetical protein
VRRVKSQHMAKSQYFESRSNIGEKAGRLEQFKFEYRNPKSETNPNDQNSNDLNKFKSMDEICLRKCR